MPETFKALEAWGEGSAQTLAALLTQEVTLENPCEPELLEQDRLEEYLGLAYSMPFNLSGVISGPMLLALEGECALSLASLMLGEDEPTEDLTKLHFEVLSEAFKQMISGLPESLYDSLSIDGVTVTEGSANFGPLAGIGAKEYKVLPLVFAAEPGPFNFHLLVPCVLAEELAEASKQRVDVQESSLSSNPSNPPSAAHSSPDFQSFTSHKVQSESRDLDIILDVPMEVTAVLGNTSICMEELINLGKGSVLELDKLAGEPVELFVHGRQIAIGEVVVIDERFGVKILEMSNARTANRSSYLMPRVG